MGCGASNERETPRQQYGSTTPKVAPLAETGSTRSAQPTKPPAAATSTSNADAQISALHADVTSNAARQQQDTALLSQHTREAARHAQESAQQTKQVKAAVKSLAARADAGVERIIARVDALAAGGIGGSLPTRVSNIPRVCTNFTARANIVDDIDTHYASADVAGIECPLVALTGIAGSGKSELAKQYALRHYKREEMTTTGEPSSPAAASFRLVWFLNAESSETLLRSYKALCAALLIEWKAEAKETEEDTLMRHSHDLQEKLRRYDAMLLFDNAVSLADLQPFLPKEEGVRARILLTSLNDALLPLPLAAGHAAVSLNRGLSEDEALSLLEATSGVATEPSCEEQPSAQALLVRQLDRLPLAVSTAGLLIAAERTPRRGQGADSPSSAYGAADFLRALKAHSSDLLQADATLNGQSDYKVGQMKALQMAISKTPPRFRALLDLCSMLDSQALPYDLMVTLYARISATVIDEAEAQADSPKSPVSPMSPGVSNRRAAEKAFDAMLSSPCTFSLLCVDAATNRLFMHRSTQLQLKVLAQQLHGAGSGDAGLVRAPSLVRATTFALRTVAAPSEAELATLSAAPSPLQLWQSGLLTEVLGAMAETWPAREEDTPSVLRLEPALPTVARLASECTTLPILHAELAPLHALLMTQVQLAMLCMEAREQWTDLQQLAAAVRQLCAPTSEAAQTMRFWQARALGAEEDAVEAIRLLQSLLDELQRDHPADRLELRSRVAIRLAHMRRASNPTAALALCESTQKWLGEQESLRMVQTLEVTAYVFVHLDQNERALASARAALAMAEVLCDQESTQAAALQALIARRTIAAQDALERYRIASSVFTRVYGASSGIALKEVLALADRTFSVDAAAAVALLQERESVLSAQLGEHEKVAEYLGKQGSLLWKANQRAQALEAEKRSYEMYNRVHGSSHISTLAALRTVAERTYELSRKDASVEDISPQLRATFLEKLPSVQGRLPVIISTLFQCTSSFSSMGDKVAALAVARHSASLASAKLPAQHPLTAMAKLDLALQLRGRRGGGCRS